MKGIRILNGGMLTTVQDLGRLGYSAYGVSPGGAMDSWAMKIANRLVGNDDGRGGLEITSTGLKIQWRTDALFSITGGDLGAFLNDQPLRPWCAYPAKKGDILGFNKGHWGLRAYLAIAGGFELPKVMGSQSTDLKGKFGGFLGRKLLKGDELSIGNNTTKDVSPMIEKEVPENMRGYEDFHVLRVISGPHEDRFTEGGIKEFFRETFHVGQAFDRMGYRLEGKKIDPGDEADILSDGMMFGAIQVPGDGIPIIMGADRQTTGGYRKIAHVISLDLGKLAQKTWKDPVKFKEISLDQAHRELKEREKNWEKWVEGLKEAIPAQSDRRQRKNERYFQVTVNGKSYKVKVEEA